MRAGRSSRGDIKRNSSSGTTEDQGTGWTDATKSSPQRQTPILLTTTPSLEGRPIRHHLGLVHSETILGANLIRDIQASIRDLIGGRAGAYETTLEREREKALQELSRRARLLGADTVVGVRIDVEVLGQAGGMLMACATGTAVALEPPAQLLPTPPLPPQRSDHG